MNKLKIPPHLTREEWNSREEFNYLKNETTAQENVDKMKGCAKFLETRYFLNVELPSLCALRLMLTNATECFIYI